ncbi:MAG: hypothetical protein ACHQFW_07705, partial [Chitinophagales bacterium]
MRKLILLLALFISVNSFPQVKWECGYNPLIALYKKNPQAPTSKYWIYFTDKANSPFSTQRPAEYLSPRAIERRNKFNIPVTYSDLPVNSEYIDQLKLFDVLIETESKWLNAVSCKLNAQQLNLISNLYFVKEISPVNKYIIVDENTLPQDKTSFYKNASPEEVEDIYGAASAQI